MAIDKILNRLPSHFNKSVDSNNYKALSLVADAIDDSEKLYDTILKFWDVDQAVGVGLDRLGEDEGISRGSYDDETYRKMIKVQFVVNMSTGDIESINKVFSFYLGERFIGVDEGWRVFKEPASLVLNAYPPVRGVLSLGDRLKAAGVKLYISISILEQGFTYYDNSYSYPIYYKTTNDFCGESATGNHNLGGLSFFDDSYSYPVYYEDMHTILYQEINTDAGLNHKDDSYSYPIYYEDCGNFETLDTTSVQFNGATDIDFEAYSYPVYYPVCGEFEAGG